MNTIGKILDYMYVNRKGLMGTVILHMLVAIALLLIQIKTSAAKSEIEILFEPSEVETPIVKDENEESKDKSEHDNEVEEMLRSVATNENINKTAASSGNIQQYLDEVMEDIDNSIYASNKQGYKASLDKHYKNDSSQNASDKRNRKIDSLKSTIYSGKSSVSYDLKDRFARNMPIPVFKCERGGKVVVMIAVNTSGRVVKAVVDVSRSIDDENIHDVAVEAALRSIFNEKQDAPNPQKGTITYNFVKQ